MFVMPKGWAGIRDIRERMKKQHIKIGEPNAEPARFNGSYDPRRRWHA